MKIEVKTYDEWSRVFVDGKIVKAFNLLEEDYAKTLAHNYAVRLRTANKQINSDR